MALAASGQHSRVTIARHRGAPRQQRAEPSARGNLPHLLEQGSNMSDTSSFDMGSRGVTRPMAEAEHQPATESQGKEHTDEHEHTSHDRWHMLEQHHAHTLWLYWSLLLFGLWLLVAPFSLGYLDESAWRQPSGGRGVWWSSETHDALRAWLMTGSDLVSGVLLLILGWRSLKPGRAYSLWGCCFVGIWLVMAPVLFWAPVPSAFFNGSLVGMLVIALTILIPGMPNMILYMQHGPGTPPGWSYNPSSWAQRWILIATGFAGFITSRHLAMYQLGYIDQIWDPFFGTGTTRVLDSKMSHSWPISDAGLGTISYTFEFLMGFMGSPKRWRTMPWMVAFFGILVIPLGLTHILLVISQPLVVGEWCTLCLLAAAIMLPMIPLEVDEVIAMGQHMVQAKRRGDRDGSVWRVFWLGGKADGCTEDERSPSVMQLPDQPKRVFAGMFWGFNIPWRLLATTAVGIWFMFQPAALGKSGDAAAPLVALGSAQLTSADVFHLCGSLLVVTSIIAMGETLRAGRYFNLLLALVLGIAPWLGGNEAISALLGTAGALVVVGLSLPRGKVHQRYGSWDRLVI